MPTNPPIKFREVDGSPSLTNPSEFIVPNGSLSRDGTKLTFTPSGGTFTNPGSGARTERFGSGALTGTGTDNTVFGYDAQVTANNQGTAIGALSRSFGGSATALGYNARATGGQDVAIGANAQVERVEGIAIGYNSHIGSSSIGSFAIGYNANAQGGGNEELMGDNVYTLADSAIQRVIAIGGGMTVGHRDTMVLGFGSDTTHSVSLTTAANQLLLGVRATAIGDPTTSGIKDIYIGQGVTSPTSHNVSIQPTSASGTDIAAGNLTHIAGLATGNAASGSYIVKTGAVGSTGTTLQTATTALTIDPLQNVWIGSSLPTAKYRLTIGNDNAAGTISLGAATLPNGYIQKHKNSAANQGVALSYNARFNSDASANVYDDQTNFESGQIRYAIGANVGGGWSFYTAEKTAAITSKMQIANSGEVGIGFASQSSEILAVRGTGTTSAAFSLTVRNSTPSMLFSVRNDGRIALWATNTAAGTTSTQTIDKPSGTVNIAAAGTTATVNNALCTTASIIIPVLRTNDSTTWIKNCVAGAGSFVITLGAAANAEVSIGWMIIN